MCLTAFPNGVDTSVVRDGVRKTAAYTVVANTESGKTFYIDSGAVTFTLPAIADGQVFTFVNMNPDGAAALTISPNANDGIQYKGSKTDDKDLINTAATAKKGDYVKVAAIELSATSGAWSVTDVSGVWAKEA